MSISMPKGINYLYLPGTFDSAHHHMIREDHQIEREPTDLRAGMPIETLQQTLRACCMEDELKRRFYSNAKGQKKLKRYFDSDRYEEKGLKNYITLPDTLDFLLSGKQGKPLRCGEASGARRDGDVKKDHLAKEVLGILSLRKSRKRISSDSSICMLWRGDSEVGSQG